MRIKNPAASYFYLAMGKVAIDVTRSQLMNGGDGETCGDRFGDIWRCEKTDPPD